MCGFVVSFPVTGAVAAQRRRLVNDPIAEEIGGGRRLQALQISYGFIMDGARYEKQE